MLLLGNLRGVILEKLLMELGLNWSHFQNDFYWGCLYHQAQKKVPVRKKQICCEVIIAKAKSVLRVEKDMRLSETAMVGKKRWSYRRGCHRRQQ